MDRTGTIRALGAELANASGAGDWDRLGQAVRALPARLQALSARGPLTQAERAALAQLRAAYEAAEIACGRAARELGARLDEMYRNKDGWMAYALDGKSDLDENHP